MAIFDLLELRNPWTDFLKFVNIDYVWHATTHVKICRCLKRGVASLAWGYGWICHFSVFLKFVEHMYNSPREHWLDAQCTKRRVLVSIRFLGGYFSQRGKFSPFLPPKTEILGAWIDISSQICKKFKFPYLQIQAPDWHKIWQADVTYHRGFMGGLIRTYNNSK